MVIKRFLQSLGVASLLLLAVPISASALTATQDAIPGASNATDYQPPTGNPQNNVGGVSQGQTGQSNLQPQQTVEQTGLPNVTDLRVQGVTGQPNPNTTKTEVTVTKQQTTKAWPFVLFSGLALVAVLYVVLPNQSKGSKDENKSQSDPSEKTSEPTTVEPAKIEVVQEADTTEEQPQPKPTTASKKTAKRKKGKTGKRSKRKR